VSFFTNQLSEKLSGFRPGIARKPYRIFRSFFAGMFADFNHHAIKSGEIK